MINPIRGNGWHFMISFGLPPSLHCSPLSICSALHPTDRHYRWLGVRRVVWGLLWFSLMKRSQHGVISSPSCVAEWLVKGLLHILTSFCHIPLEPFGWPLWKSAMLPQWEPAEETWLLIVHQLMMHVQHGFTNNVVQDMSSFNMMFQRERV